MKVITLAGVHCIVPVMDLHTKLCLQLCRYVAQLWLLHLLPWAKGQPPTQDQKNQDALLYRASCLDPRQMLTTAVGACIEGSTLRSDRVSVYPKRSNLHRLLDEHACTGARTGAVEFETCQGVGVPAPEQLGWSRWVTRCRVDGEASTRPMYQEGCVVFRAAHGVPESLKSDDPVAKASSSLPPLLHLADALRPPLGVLPVGVEEGVESGFHTTLERTQG